MDLYPPPGPAGFANFAGALVSSTAPAHTMWQEFYLWGAMYSQTATDAQTVTASTASTSNYAAPQSIATETYSQSLAYYAWLGVTQTTGANGETLTMTYDTMGRPATAKNAWASQWSSYPATYTYTYSAQNVTPVTQTKTGFDGVTTTTLDGLGRPIRARATDQTAPVSSVSSIMACDISRATLPLPSVNGCIHGRRWWAAAVAMMDSVLPIFPYTCPKRSRNRERAPGLMATCLPTFTSRLRSSPALRSRASLRAATHRSADESRKCLRL